jgi:ADP-ribosyl-[dinitrogen reductase] hydrolase
MTDQPLQDRAVGCLLGLAVRDALGTTLEFSARDTAPPLTDLIGGGPFHLPAGT